MYRDSNGNRCAVGMLINDNEYSTEMEGNIILSTINNAPSLLMKNKGYDLNFLEMIQWAHDGSDDMDKWEKNMLKVSSAYLLNYTLPSDTERLASDIESEFSIGCSPHTTTDTVCDLIDVPQICDIE